uniref:Uncharacterized protein n=1 Tax=Anguilla anguilla TaxID=7936 RepID=A0A0E9SN85_ANGAN
MQHVLSHQSVIVSGMLQLLTKGQNKFHPTFGLLFSESSRSCSSLGPLALSVEFSNLYCVCNQSQCSPQDFLP